MNVLLLAGTAEARQLAALLADEPGVDVTASLAGHTSAPARYRCAVRTGGFGGTEGLAAYLEAAAVEAVVDATHPCSRVMPGRAAATATSAGVPRLRLARPPWAPQPGDVWHDADDVHHAARLLTELDARRVLLTVGRLQLAAFAHVAASFVVRTIEPPHPLPLPPVEVVRARGPFSVAEEVDLLRQRGIDAVVTRNAGGGGAKLTAARALGLPVVVIRRPAAVPGPTVETAPAARDWVLEMLSSRPGFDLIVDT